MRITATRWSGPGRLAPRLVAGFGLAVLVTSLAACSAGTAAEPDASAEPIKIVVNYEPNATGTLLRLALDEGIFEDNGLDVELFEGGPGSSAMPLLVNGQLDVVPTATQAGILAAAEGLPIVLASNQANEVEGIPQYATVGGGGQGITSFADLSGKTVGIHSNACCWEEFTRDAVARQGGDPDSVSFLQVPFPNQFQALRDGQVDAITTVQPFATIALNAGGEMLGQTPLVALDTDVAVGGAFFMSKAFVEQNPGVLEAWQASIAAASELVEADPEKMKALIAQETGLDVALVEQMPVPRFTTILTEELYEATIAFLVRYGALDEDKAPPADEFLAPGVTG